MDVQRYDMGARCGDWCEPKAKPCADIDGEWVRYDDHAAEVADKSDSMKVMCEETRILREEVARLHRAAMDDSRSRVPPSKAIDQFTADVSRAYKGRMEELASLRAEVARLREALVLAYTRGYRSGHHDTVEGGYVDVHQSDEATYFADQVEDFAALTARKDGAS